MKDFLHFHQIGRYASIKKNRYKVLPTFTFVTQRKSTSKPRDADIKVLEIFFQVKSQNVMNENRLICFFILGLQSETSSFIEL